MLLMLKCLKNGLNKKFPQQYKVSEVPMENVILLEDIRYTGNVYWNKTRYEI